MANKTVNLPDIGSITLYKRRGARSIRLSIRGNTVRVTVPYWLPYQAGVEFARQHAAWISKHRVQPELLTDEMSVGKYHDLYFESSAAHTRPTTRTQDGRITVKLPSDMDYTHPVAQAAAAKSSIRALKREAEELLPSRLRRLAAKHGFTFKSVEIKRLKSRWGSCNQQKEIVLNCFLMQLPWELIDYVLLHELLHTQIMAHGPRFWAELGKRIPNLPETRKTMRSHRPLLNGPLNMSNM